MSHISLKFKQKKEETAATRGCCLLCWSFSLFSLTHSFLAFTHTFISQPACQSVCMAFSLPFMTTCTSCLHTHANTHFLASTFTHTHSLARLQHRTTAFSPVTQYVFNTLVPDKIFYMCMHEKPLIFDFQG